MAITTSVDRTRPAAGGKRPRAAGGATGTARPASSRSLPPARTRPVVTAAARGLGSLSLGALVAALLTLGASAASGPSFLVPASRHGLPDWVAGPLRGLGAADPGGRYEALLLVICATYVLVLACAPVLGRGVLISGIVLAHLAALAAPPLFSADVFGYLDFARLGVLHGLDPYTHTAAAAAHDAIYPYLGWHDVRSPYGPVFTLFTYALVPLGVTAGIWVLKVTAAVASLGTVVLVWRSAARRGQSPERAAALLGLNPLVLVFAVAGAHNDTLVELVLAAGLVVCLDRREAGGTRRHRAHPMAGRSPGRGAPHGGAQPVARRGRAGRQAATLTAAAGLKVSAGLALPFALLGARGAGRARPALAAAACTLAGIALIAAIAFGLDAAALAGTVRGQQQLVATHSLPSEISRLLGYGRLGGSVRTASTLLLAGALIAALAHAWRHAERWLEAYGWATLALLCSTAWLLPWYGTWALLPAALSRDRRLRAATLVLCGYLVATRLPLADPLLGG